MAGTIWPSWAIGLSVSTRASITWKGRKSRQFGAAGHGIEVVEAGRQSGVYFAPGRALPQEEQTARPECAGDSARYTARGYSRLDGRLVSKSDICAGRGGAGVVEWRRLFEIRSWEEVAALPTARGQRPRLQGGRDGRYYNIGVGWEGGGSYYSRFSKTKPSSGEARFGWRPGNYWRVGTRRGLAESEKLAKNEPIFGQKWLRFTRKRHVLEEQQRQAGCLPASKSRKCPQNRFS